MGSAPNAYIAVHKIQLGPPTIDSNFTVLYPLVNTMVISPNISNIPSDLIRDRNEIKTI